MTIDQFNNTRFGAGLKASYNGTIYNLQGIDFTECLFELKHPGWPDDAFWVRCENAEIT